MSFELDGPAGLSLSLSPQWERIIDDDEDDEEMGWDAYGGDGDPSQDC